MKKERITDAIYLLLGSIIYAVSVDVFTTPFGIAPGGVTGVSIVLNRLINVPVGMTIVILNIPLFALSYKILGRMFIAKSIIATLMTSVFIDLFTNILPAFRGDGLLAAVYAGVTSGIGLSLIFLRGGTTGGTDIAARLLHNAIPFISVGKFILAVDTVIIISSAVIFKSVNSALYAIIIIFASTTVIDKIINGAEAGKMIYVFSEKYDEIKGVIIERSKRGVTRFRAVGGFTDRSMDVLMCVVRRNEMPLIIRLVKEVDPEAFVVVGEAGNVLGKGFEKTDNN